jgi:NAD(P)-dependent dehydrogenase (short-subunit alcohol dehydrogenase family)
MAGAGENRIVVTGASSGIGRACASRFAQLGYTVFAGVRKAEDAEALRADRIRPILLDVTDAESIATALAAVGDAPLSGLVNNAGIAVTGPLELVSMDAWRAQFAVNVLGMVAVTQAFLPLLRQAKGRIVNVGSVAGRCALPGSAAYDSSKFAIEAISDSLRMELRPFGITVSLIEPGAVVTPLWRKTLAAIEDLRQTSSPEVYDRYARLMNNLQKEAAHAMRNAVSPETVAKAVEHAMLARRPKTRYLIGSDAWLFLFLSWLPSRLRDSLILSQLHR